LANDGKSEQHASLDKKAFGGLVNKLNRGEVDLNSNDIAVLENIDAVYQEISKKPSKEYYLELLGDIATETEKLQFKTPAAYLLRSELQLLASYIVAKLDEKYFKETDWKLVKESYDKITRNNLDEVKKIFSEMVELPYDQIKSISDLYFEVGEKLLPHIPMLLPSPDQPENEKTKGKWEKLSTYGQLMGYFMLIKTEEEKKISDKLTDEEKFEGANSINLFDFSQVIKKGMNFIIIRRAFFTKFTICSTNLIIFAPLNSERLVLNRKKDVKKLTVPEIKWLLNEPESSITEKDFFIRNLLDFVESEEVYKNNLRGLYTEFISGFLK